MKYIVVVSLLALLTACSDFSLPPKMIVADGQAHYACKGYVRSFQNTFGGETYTVEFTNRDGHKVQLRGVSKLAIADMPTHVWSEMPANLPDPKISKEGSWVGDWNTSNRAILVDGAWRPVTIENPACAGGQARKGSAVTEKSATAAGQYPSVSLAEWEAMTPAQQAAYKGVIDLPDRPK